MPMISSDVATVWRRVREDVDGASWERSVLSGVRCEALRGASASDPGPDVADGLTLYVWGCVAISPGDRVAEGESGDENPPAGSLRVTRVTSFSLGGRPHHMEVECR